MIDAHVHVWTSDTSNYSLADGYCITQMRPASFTPEEFLAVARPCGVERTVLIQMDFYGYDNSYLIATLQEFPGIFSGVAQVDEHGIDPAAELRRLKAMGVRGVRIAPARHGDGAWLESPGMRAIWQCGAHEQLAVCPLIAPEDLMALNRMCSAFPDTPVVVDHFAGVGSDGVIREADLRQLCCLAKYPSTHVKLSAFYHLGSKRPPYLDLMPMIRRLHEEFGAHRLMWASDCPYQIMPPHNYEDSLSLVRDRLNFLRGSDREWVLYRTAEKVFF